MTATKHIQTLEEAMKGFELMSYDKYLICMSGGKDSIDSYLELKEAGVPHSKMEFWHHDIDGHLEDGESNFMDWVVTRGYVTALGKALGIPVFFSWRDGGFKGEMLRNGQYECSKTLDFDLTIAKQKREFCKRNIIVKKTELEGSVSFTMQEVECNEFYKEDEETGEQILDKVERVKPKAKIGNEFTLIVDKTAFTGAIFYEDENHNVQSTTPSYNPLYLGQREKFPAVVADLQTRWCSSALKIDVCASAIRNQKRFIGKRTLVITGERAQESMKPKQFEQLMAGTLPDSDRKGRATYDIVEIDRSDTRDSKTVPRHIDHYRPLRDRREKDVWARMKKHGIRPHVAYEMGYGRVSCINCIFGNKDQWASSAMISPDSTDEVSKYEKQFGYTIVNGKDEDKDYSVAQMIKEGTPYTEITPDRIALANSKVYPFDILIDPKDWVMPAGAFKEGCGSPT